MSKKNKIVVILAAFVIVVITVISFCCRGEKNIITYNDFQQLLSQQSIDKVIYNPDSSEFQIIVGENTYYCSNPRTENFKYQLLARGIEVEEPEEVQFSLAIFIQLLFYVVFGVVLFKSTRKFLNTKPKELAYVPDVSFNDVAGQQELKQDLQYVINYLQNPEKYEKIGARMPKGIILEGPPGTGKTLMAKAIAGTAKVPFFSANGSDFVELYVGLGAKRVRELYTEAKTKAPCIVFIDEIDAIGGSRNNPGMNSENNQTINALLSELDGFNGTEGVVTICATNLSKNLDEALVRPGRFDKQFYVGLPDIHDRSEIIKVHTRNKHFSKDIDWHELSAMTTGFSGAAIESLLNEAAFIAVNNDRESISKEDINRAFYKTVLKGDVKSDQTRRDKEELRIVAWHESGHVLATKLYTDDDISKVTILASTSGAGGVTFRTPKEKGLISKRYLNSQIQIMYAGRAAEQVYFNNPDEITTGASDDIRKATEMIRSYICEYGMSDDFGLINTDVFPESSEKIMETAKDVAKTLYNKVHCDMIKHKETLGLLATKLLENETLTGENVSQILADRLKED